MGNKGENKIKNYNDYLKETMDRIDWNEENAKAWIRKDVEEKITDIMELQFWSSTFLLKKKEN